MKDCRNVRELLSPYLENELQGEKLQGAERHLSTCADCRAELELLRLTVRTLREIPDLPAPAGILQGVRKGLEPVPWYRRLGSLLFPPRSGRVPLGALASILVAFGIFLVYDRYPEVGKAPIIAPPVEERIPLPQQEAAGRAEVDRRERVTAPAPAEKETVVPVLPSGDRREAEPEEADGDAGPADTAPPPESSAVEVMTETKPEAAVPPRSWDTPGTEAARTDAVTEKISPEPLPSPRAYLEAPPPAPRPPQPPSAPEPVAPPPVRIVTEKEAQETPREKGSGLPVPGKERLDTLRDGRGADTYRELPVEQRSVAPPPRVMKKAARKSMAEEGVVSFAAPPDKVRGKSLPGPLAKDDVILGLTGDDSPARESTAALSEEAMRGTRPDVTEVLTVVSLDEGEVDDLRERLRRAGGRLLEMRTLDAFATQQLAQPYQEKIPPSQIVSRGWQIRAAVPRSSVEDFIASFAGKSSLQLLHRATEPLSWSQERGHQNFEINLIH